MMRLNLCGALLLALLPTLCRGEAAVDELAKLLGDESKTVADAAAAPFAKTALSKADAKRAAKLLLKRRMATLRKERAAEMEKREIAAGNLKMRFFYKVFGDKPADGRSLYISLHGGGGTAPRVNDQQWENQKRLYSPKEGVYLAPRAATNTWNLWHQGHIDGMFQRLIENLVVFEDVNPNKVYVMGYSAGGDGVYQLAGRMADRWAAAAMMAGHPNDSSPLGLRNIGFTLHMGGRDAAYNRNKVAADWEKRLAKLQADDPQGYQHWVKIYPNKGHWMDREDRAAVPWMAKFKRNPYPRRIVWQQDDVTHERFYWLAVNQENRKGRALLTAECAGQQIQVNSEQVKALKIRLHDAFIDLDKPLTVKAADRVVFQGRAERTIAAISHGLGERADPQSLFTAEIDVALTE